MIVPAHQQLVERRHLPGGKPSAGELEQAIQI
jgi:hypothetical protein